VLIGDVSGKGVSAALYMAKVVSEFRNIAHRTDAPDETLQQLHTRLSSSPRGMFLTCIYLVVDTLTGNVRLSVAGHPPLMHIHEGKVEVMALPSGPPLGILDSEYPVESLSLSAGSKIILLTDGVFDAKNSAGKRLGFEQITDMVKDYAGEDNIIQRIEDSVDKYSQSVKQADDLTLVQIEMNKP
jgi:sigma-B regulation protein RsbU (phosphoserine phosphatase)